MAVLTQKEFMENLNKLLGDRTDDEALKFIEDANDTITEHGDEWKDKYETLVQEKDDLDKAWRQRYRDRFFSSDTSLDDKGNHDNNHSTNPATPKDDIDDELAAKLEQANKIRCDDLFTPEK